MKITDEEIIVAGDALSKYFTKKYNIHPNDRDDLQQEISIALLLARERHNPEKGTWRQFSFYAALYAFKSYFRESPRIGEKFYRGGKTKFIISSLEEQLNEPAEEFSPFGDLEKEFSDLDLTQKEKRILVCLMMGYTSEETAYILNTSYASVVNHLGLLRIKNSEYYFTPLMDSQQNKQVA